MKSCLQQQASPWKPSSLSSPPPHEPGPTLADPWLPTNTGPKTDPWGTPVIAPSLNANPTKQQDPWSPTSQSSTDLDEFDVISNRNKETSSPKTNGTTTR